MTTYWLSIKTLESALRGIKIFDLAIQKDSENSSYYSGKADTLRDMNRYEEALKYFDLAIQHNPEGSEYYGGKADSLRHQIGQKKLYIIPIQLYNGILTWLIIMNQKIIANILKFMFRLEEASKYFDLAIAKNPKNPNYYAQKADSLRVIKRFAEALTCCNQALKLDPQNLDYLQIKILTLIHMNHNKEASEHLQQLRQILPKEVINNLYWQILIQVKRYNEHLNS